MGFRIKIFSRRHGRIQETYYIEAVYKRVPLRVLTIATFIDTTLYILADIVMAIHLAQTMRNFGCIGKRASLAHFFFTAVTVLIYPSVIVETIITFRRNKEILWLSRLTSSLLIIFEEVPLPICMLIIFTTERRMPLERATLVTAVIKLTALCLGIIKFTRLNFCWFFYPCRNRCRECKANIKRCFTLTWYRSAMLFVNICHFMAIALCVITVILASTGGIKYATDTQPCKTI